MKLDVQELTPDAFVAFGDVIQKPLRAPDAQGADWQWWGENSLLPPLRRAYGVGYLAAVPGKRHFDWAERHMHTQEMIIPLTGDCLVYVGPPDHPDRPDHLPALERFRVFRVPQGDAVILKEGVWHGAPLAVNAPVNVMVLLQQATGQDDLHLVRFAESPVEIIG